MRRTFFTIRFDLRALLFFLVIFLVELCIALFVSDRIIRPYVGDMLVIALIYYFFRSFLRVDKLKLLTAVLLFACIVEVAQYYNLVQHLGLQHSRFWVIVIGNSFHWLDIVAYVAGSALVGLIEFGRKSKGAAK